MTALLTVDVVPAPHPAAERFPMMSEKDLRDLADDIAAHGLIHPVVVFAGQLLDGRNRVAACRLANVEPRIEVLPACDSPTSYVVSANDKRRHLTPAQRSAIGADPVVQKSYRDDAKKRQETGQERGRESRGLVPSGSRTEPNSPKKDRHNKAVQQAAADLGVGRDSVYDMMKLRVDAPEVYEAAKRGEFKTVAEAKRAAAPPTPEPVVKTARRAGRDDRDSSVAALHAEGLAPSEIAKRLGCSRSSVFHSKRRLGLTDTDNNPLRRLTDYAVEFCDTWDHAIAADASQWEGAAPEHVSAFVKQLKTLVQKTHNLIRRLNKEATGEQA